MFKSSISYPTWKDCRERLSTEWGCLSLACYQSLIHLADMDAAAQTNHPSLSGGPCQIYSPDNTNAFHTLHGKWRRAYISLKGPHGASCLSTVWKTQRGGWRGCRAPHPWQTHSHMTSRCLHSCRLQAAKGSGCRLAASFFLGCKIRMVWFCHSKALTTHLSRERYERHSDSLVSLYTVHCFHSCIVWWWNIVVYA